MHGQPAMLESLDCSGPNVCASNASFIGLLHAICSDLVHKARTSSPVAFEAGTFAAESGEAAARAPAACRAAAARVLAAPGFAPRDEIFAIRSSACCGVGIRMCPCCTFRFSVLFQWFLVSSKHSSSAPILCILTSNLAQAIPTKVDHIWTVHNTLRELVVLQSTHSRCLASSQHHKLSCVLCARADSAPGAHLMLLSVRPGSICAILAHLLGCCPCSASSSRSSSRDHGSWLMPGSRWLHHLTEALNLISVKAVAGGGA